MNLNQCRRVKPWRILNRTHQRRNSGIGLCIADQTDFVPAYPGLCPGGGHLGQRSLDSVIRRGHSRVPVYDESIDKVVGVLYAKDLLRAVGVAGDLEVSVRPQIRQEVFFVPETQKIAVTLKEMQRRRVHLGVVVDEFGGFSGIITIEDIIEELVGDIRDEYDREEEMVRKGG